MERMQLLTGIYTSVNEVCDVLKRAGNIAAIQSLNKPEADETLQQLYDALQEMSKTAHIMLDAAHKIGKKDEKVA